MGAFLVYDVTNIQSFINLRDWLHKIREFSDPNVVIALVANKADLVDEDDRQKGYGKYGPGNQDHRYSGLSDQILETEEDNENSINVHRR